MCRQTDVNTEVLETKRALEKVYNFTYLIDKKIKTKSGFGMNLRTLNLNEIIKYLNTNIFLLCTYCLLKTIFIIYMAV